MKENYVLDIASQSTSLNNTPSLGFQRLPFYVHNCGHFFANPSYYTHREGLGNYLLLYTISGCGHLIYEGTGYNLDPNSVVTFNCSSPHFYHTQSSEPWEFLYIHYNGSAATLYDHLLNDQCLSKISLRDESIIPDALSTILDLIDMTDPSKELNICNLVLSIYTELITSNQNSSGTNGHLLYTNEMNDVIDYIKTNHQRKISTDELAKLAALSKFHFIRLFKRHTGLSPYEYLINFRINHSKNLLKNTTKTIGEISTLVGFNDVNNYIRYFNKLVGTTPGVFRKHWL